MAAADTARLAVLIDADNATASVVKELLEEVAKYGTATVKRAYGDRTTQNLVGWGAPASPCDPAHAPLRLHHRQELDRLGLHHRRHGPAARQQPRRLLSGAPPPVQVQVAGMPDLKGLVTHAVKETSRDSGWASLSAVGSFINNNNTSFDPRNYGFSKLSELVRKQACLEVKETTDGSGFVHLSVRSR